MPLFFFFLDFCLSSLVVRPTDFYLTIERMYSLVLHTLFVVQTIISYLVFNTSLRMTWLNLNNIKWCQDNWLFVSSKGKMRCSILKWCIVGVQRRILNMTTINARDRNFFKKKKNKHSVFITLHYCYEHFRKTVVIFYPFRYHSNSSTWYGDRKILDIRRKNIENIILSLQSSKTTNTNTIIVIIISRINIWIPK